MSKPMTTECLAEIDARAEAATPGPWGFYDGDNYADVAADLEMTGRGSYSCRQQVARLEDESYWDDPAHEEDDEERASEQMAADAAFIAHARADIPDLIARVRELEEAATEARAALGALCFDLEDPGSAAYGALHLVTRATTWTERNADFAALALVDRDTRLLNRLADMVDPDIGEEAPFGHHGHAVAEWLRSKDLAREAEAGEPK